MKNLVIDTSGNNIKLLFQNNDDIILSEHETASQSTDLIYKLLELLKQNDTDISEISKIGVIIGPGSFTGIRLSIAFAKGLSIGNPNIKLVPISVFDIYSNMTNIANTIIKIDSGRGDFFVAVSNGIGKYLIEPCTMTDDEIRQTIKKYNIINSSGDNKYDLKQSLIFLDKNLGKTMIPLYLRPHYAESHK